MVDPELRALVGEMQRRAFELQLPVEGEADEELLVPDAGERLSEVRARTLVLVGDDDVSNIAVIAKGLEREIPDVRRASITGTAHLPIWSARRSSTSSSWLSSGALARQSRP